MPNSAPPARTTLIAVTGLTPAVLTETLWGLASGPTPVIPDHIVVITTLTGRAKLTEQLLSDGRWEAFRAALRRHLGRKHAHLLTDDHLRFGTAQAHLRVIPTPGPQPRMPMTSAPPPTTKPPPISSCAPSASSARRRATA